MKKCMKVNDSGVRKFTVQSVGSRDFFTFFKQMHKVRNVKMFCLSVQVLAAERKAAKVESEEADKVQKLEQLLVSDVPEA